MADETPINGEFSDDRDVEIAGDEASLKISGLNQKISDLEQENRTVIRENKELKLRIEELKSSIEDLSVENVDLKTQVDKAGSENQVLQVMAARAAELETEVSTLKHDLASAKSDLQNSTVVLSGLKRDLECMRSRERKKDVELEAAEREKAALVGEVEKLLGFERGFRVELGGKEKEIEDLKMNVKELEMVVGNSKSVETLKEELEKKIMNMKAEISSLESSLDEKEKVMNGFETKERAIFDAINGDGVVEGGRKGSDWLIVGGSAIAVIGVACYILSARKH